MQRINKKTTLITIGLTALGLAAFAQEMPNPQQAAPATATTSTRETANVRRQALQRLSTDFGAAIKNGSLSADDTQKAQSALAQLQPYGKGSPRDPKGRHDAMKTVRHMSVDPALRPEDRELLAKDLAAIPSKAAKNRQ